MIFTDLQHELVSTTVVIGEQRATKMKRRNYRGAIGRGHVCARSIHNTCPYLMHAISSTAMVLLAMDCGG